MKTVTTIISATRLSLYANAAFAGTSYTYHAYSRDSKVHEQFFCTVKNANDSNVVTGSDYAEMVKGFNSNGRLNSNVGVINSVYFDA